MAKKNSKQERLLKRYSKGGFTNAERKLLSKKLGLKLSKVRRLTKAYSKQLKISSSSKNTTNKNTNKSKSNPFNIKSSTYAPGVSAPGVKKPKGYDKTPNPFKGPSIPKNPGVPYHPDVIKAANKKTPPKNTTQPKNPSSPVDPNNIAEIVRGIIGDQTPTAPELTVDPRIGNLEGELETANTNLENLQNLYNTSNENYLNQVDQLRGDISGYEDQIGSYRDQVSDMSSQLLEQAQNARQFKKMDTQYLSNNTASGIRLRRSKKFRSGDFALGTSGLNRKNRSPLKISNVNL